MNYYPCLSVFIRVPIKFLVAALPRCVLCALCGENVFSSFLEEALQEVPAFFPEDPWGHLHPVIEPGVFQQRKKRSGAPFGIFRSEYEAPNPRLDHGPRAHDARFQGHIQGAAGEPVIFDPRRPFAKGKNLCVSRRIDRGDGAVPAAPDDFPSQDQNRPDGYFPFFPGHPGLFKGNPHELRVFAVQGPKIDGRLSVFLPGGEITWRKGTL